MQPIVELYDSNHALEASQDLLGGDLLVPIDAVGDGFVRVRNRGGDTASYTIHIKTMSAPSQFGDPIELFLGTLASSVAIGDLNNDGRNDIAFLLGDASASPDTLVTLLQTSNRSFTLGDVIATDVTVGRALSIGDLDGDNENDVALAVAGGVDIYTQSGGALDPTATFVVTGTTPAQIAVPRRRRPGQRHRRRRSGRDPRVLRPGLRCARCRRDDDGDHEFARGRRCERQRLRRHRRGRVGHAARVHPRRRTQLRCNLARSDERALDRDGRRRSRRRRRRGCNPAQLGRARTDAPARRHARQRSRRSSRAPMRSRSPTSIRTVATTSSCCTTTPVTWAC